MPASDRQLMEMAIAQARQSVHEDDRIHPKVGVVVARDSEVLAVAHRGERDPGDHAEFVALEVKLREEIIAGATVFTTLEPCTSRNHPKVPCVERLIERKVSRVVIGILDPNPHISGKGQTRLREANIATEFFPSDLMAQVEELNREFRRQHARRVQLVAGPAGRGLQREFWNIPIPRSPFFTGRREVLERIRSGLQTLARDSERPIQAICGMGGTGKTQIAVEYAFMHRSSHPFVLWIKADSREEVVSHVLSISSLLGLSVEAERSQELSFALVRDWLSASSDTLLVIDDLGDPEWIASLIPANLVSRVLITTRARSLDELGVHEPIELGVMENDEAKQFLLARTNRLIDDDEEASALDSLVEELGRLPLALEQAGAYVARTQTTFERYLVSLRARGLELLEKSTLAIGTNRTVATAWSLNFEQVTQASEAAGDLLRASSFFDSTAIPIEIVMGGGSHLGEALRSTLQGAETDPIRIDELLAPLTEFSLVRRDLPTETFGIHKLIQLVVRSGMEVEEARDWLGRALRALNAVFPRADYANWDLCRRVAPHAIAALTFGADVGLVTSDAASLSHGVGYFLHELGLLEEAMKLYIRSRAIWESIPDERIEYAGVLNDLGGLYFALGMYPESEEAYSRALTLEEEHLPPDHEGIGATLTSIGLLRSAQGRYTEAEELHKRAAEITSAALGGGHPDTAACWINLGGVYEALGEYEEAKVLYRKALAILEARRADYLPRYATTLNNLAEMCLATGDVDEAEMLHTQALTIRESILSPNHPSVANSLGNVGRVLLRSGRPEDARDHLRRSLDILEGAVGANHPNVAIVLNNLSRAYEELRDFEQAEELLLRAESIIENNLGPDHPSLAPILINHGRFFVGRKRHREAEEHFSRAVEILRTAYTSAHPQLVIALNGLADVYQDQGKTGEAEELRREADRSRH